MFDTAFHIRLLCDDDRKSVCWALSEYPFEDGEVERLLMAYSDVGDMQIRESALFIFSDPQVQKGSVSENAAFVPFGKLKTPISTFLINDRMLTLIEGESFLEKLLNLNSALDRNSNEFNQLLSDLDMKHGLHCVAAR